MSVLQFWPAKNNAEDICIVNLYFFGSSSIEKPTVEKKMLILEWWFVRTDFYLVSDHWLLVFLCFSHHLVSATFHWFSAKIVNFYTNSVIFLHWRSQIHDCVSNSTGCGSHMWNTFWIWLNLLYLLLFTAPAWK